MFYTKVLIIQFISTVNIAYCMFQNWLDPGPQNIVACIMVREVCCSHLESSQHQSAFLGKFNLDESLPELLGIPI